MSTLGAHIRQLRQVRGFGLNQFADVVGVSRGYLSQLERGEKAKPSADLIARIASGLGVGVDELLRPMAADVRERSPAYVAEDPLRSLERLLRRIPELTRGDRSEIVEYVAFKRARRQTQTEPSPQSAEPVEAAKQDDE